jgi:hypothetical protein
MKEKIGGNPPTALAAIPALATIALALFRLYDSDYSYDRHLGWFGAAKKFGRWPRHILL